MLKKKSRFGERSQRKPRGAFRYGGREKQLSIKDTRSGETEPNDFPRPGKLGESKMFNVREERVKEATQPANRLVADRGHQNLVPI